MKCQCAVRRCRRKTYDKASDIGMKSGLCYVHGWRYACTHQSEYAYRCTEAFPLWSAGDIAIWLEWCGI